MPAPVTSLRPGVTCNQTHHARGGGRESDGAALIGLYDHAGPDLRRLWFCLPALAILVLPVFARRWFPFAGPAAY